MAEQVEYRAPFWEVYEWSLTDDVHVEPIEDILPHMSDADCHCDSRVEVHGACLLVVHNSFDGREEHE